MSQELVDGMGILEHLDLLIKDPNNNLNKVQSKLKNTVQLNTEKLNI